MKKDSVPWSQDPYLRFPNTPSWRGDQLKKAQRQLTFTFTFSQLVVMW